MRTQTVLLPAATLVALLGAAMLPARAAPESSGSLKGIVERVEGGRFQVDSAWVEPARGAGFRGTARSVDRIRVGDWAVVDGRWIGGGVFQARGIKISHAFPGHSFQNRLARQGLQEAQKLETGKKAYTDAAVEGYVRGIGLSVVPAWAGTAFRFQFNVIADPTLNAFALPDGSIFVHTGLLARIENDAQLASILGHEVAHVTERHGAQGYKKQFTTFLPAVIGAEVVGYEISKKTDNPFLRIATQLGLSLTLNAAVNGYGRTHEDQADRVGLRYAVEAGFDPSSAPRVWEVFNRTYGDQSKLENFFYGNHSTNRVRKENQEREIRRHYSDPAGLRISRPTNEEGCQLAMLALTRENAVLDFEAKRYEIARAGFDRVLRHRGSDPVAHTYLGRIALVSETPDRFAQAEVEFRKAIEGDPDYPDAHRELGHLLASQRKREEARREFQTYLNLAPADDRERKAVEKEIRKLS